MSSALSVQDRTYTTCINMTSLANTRSVLFCYFLLIFSVRMCMCRSGWVFIMLKKLVTKHWASMFKKVLNYSQALKAEEKELWGTF